MYGPDIPQLEVQMSMARIREAASKTQDAPAKNLNKQLAKDLPAEFKIDMFPFRFLAHLSRRLIGELIVYQCLRRPSSVRRQSTYSNIFSSETTRPIELIFHMETP